MVVKVNRSASITGSMFKLHELIELLNACKNMPDDASVSINISPGDYNQGSYYTITVTER